VDRAREELEVVERHTQLRVLELDPQVLSKESARRAARQDELTEVGPVEPLTFCYESLARITTDLHAQARRRLTGTSCQKKVTCRFANAFEN
jgi:hypothetical protein